MGSSKSRRLTEVFLSGALKKKKNEVLQLFLNSYKHKPQIPSPNLLNTVNLFQNSPAPL